MSDGLSEANRSVTMALSIEVLASQLADALDDVRDMVFGIEPDALEIANRELARVGVMLVLR